MRFSSEAKSPWVWVCLSRPTLTVSSLLPTSLTVLARPVILASNRSVMASRASTIARPMSSKDSVTPPTDESRVDSATATVPMCFVPKRSLRPNLLPRPQGLCSLVQKLCNGWIFPRYQARNETKQGPGRCPVSLNKFPCALHTSPHSALLLHILTTDWALMPYLMAMLLKVAPDARSLAMTL